MFNLKEIFGFQKGSLKLDIKENYQWLIIFSVLTLLLYFNLIGSEFVSDDRYLILNNLEFGNTKLLFANVFYFPSLLFQYIVFYIFGKNPTAFHFLNILLHIISVNSLFLIVYKMFNKKVAIISALLLVVHPVFTESVAWISGISTIQYSAFFLVSFLFFIYSKCLDKYFWLSYGFLLLSVSSSNRSFVVPLIFVFYLVLFKSEHWKQKILILLIPFILFLGVNILGIGGRTESLVTNYYSSAELYNPLTQVPTAVSKYIELFILPINLTLYQSEITMSGTILFFRVLMLFGFLYLGNSLYIKDKKLFFFFILFFINLAPTLTPLPVAWIVAERYAYLSFISLIIISVNYIVKVEKSIGESTVKVIFGIVIVIFAILTVLRNNDWRNEDNLWLSTGKISKSSPTTHNNLGDVYSRKGDLNRAVEEFSKAIELKPNYADAYHNL
ncbi:MAG: tetratricopeptide repeat protein, partial [bacterium]|nr:tetratricopeptide repeat protein [bacterium]